MAYFPNGTSGMDYQEKWCSRCVHDTKDDGCPVWFFHLLKNYEWCNDKENRALLDIFIPTSKEGFPEKCNMFVSNGDVQGQLIFPESEE